MAVRALGPNQYELTEDGDEILDTIWVEGFIAETTDTSGDVTVFTNILDQTQLVEDAAGTFNGGPGVGWRSPGMNANETVESVGVCGLFRGIRVTMPASARLVVNVE